jgi:hypothetical protein
VGRKRRERQVEEQLQANRTAHWPPLRTANPLMDQAISNELADGLRETGARAVTSGAACRDTRETAILRKRITCSHLQGTSGGSDFDEPR